VEEEEQAKRTEPKAGEKESEGRIKPPTRGERSVEMNSSQTTPGEIAIRIASVQLHTPRAATRHPVTGNQPITPNKLQATPPGHQYTSILTSQSTTPNHHSGNTVLLDPTPSLAP
jgi:hypothetical protein